MSIFAPGRLNRAILYRNQKRKKTAMQNGVAILPMRIYTEMQLNRTLLTDQDGNAILDISACARLVI